MNDNDGNQRQIEEHVLWCRGERDRLSHELEQCQKSILSTGKRKTGKPVPEVTVTRISYLERTIEQLGHVIAAYALPSDRPPTSVVEAQIISLASRRHGINPARGL